MVFVTKHWFSIFIILVLCFVLLKSQKQSEKLIKQVNILEITNKKLVEQNNVYLINIDSLSKRDAEIIEVIKYIKIKEDEAIIAVDTMSVSDLQKFFSKRYNK